MSLYSSVFVCLFIFLFSYILMNKKQAAKNQSYFIRQQNKRVQHICCQWMCSVPMCELNRIQKGKTETMEKNDKS